MPQETGMAHRQLHPGMEVELDHPNIRRTAVWRVWRPVPEAIIESNILHGRFDFEPTDVWSLVSTGAKLFICDLLESDPIQHPTAILLSNNSVHHVPKSPPLISSHQVK